MQNSEEWDLNYYLRDLADEIARHAFNTGRYPEINYITGNADQYTPTETNQDGSLNVYIPQDVDQQQFQQALNAYIKNGCDVIYQESQCRIQVVQCPSTKEDAQKEIQAFNAARDTEYYRLINGPNNSLYIMKCEAQTPQIKEQIQQQFENSNGYYYSQTNTYTPNSYESNSKESKYITALKMFYFTDIMPQRLPQPDQDDEEQKKLYDACQHLQYLSQQLLDLWYTDINMKLKNGQTDLDNTFKNWGIIMYDSLANPAIIQQYQAQYQSEVPVPQVPYMVSPSVLNPVVPVQEPPVITDQGYDPTVTQGAPVYSNEIQYPLQAPEQVIIPEPVNYPTPVEFPQPPVSTSKRFQAVNGFNINNINLQQEEEFEDFGTIQIERITADEGPDNTCVKVICRNNSGKKYETFFKNATLKDLINWLTTKPGISNNSNYSWTFNDSGTWLGTYVSLYDLIDKTINVKRKKKLVEIGNNSNVNDNMSPYDYNQKEISNNYFDEVTMGEIFNARNGSSI